jgi:hypothetical protein
MACCLSMSTVCATPGICQNICCCTGCGGASNTQAILNGIGKWGVSVAGILSGRPTAVSGNRVNVGASAAQKNAAAVGRTQSLLPIVLIIAAVVVILVLFGRR